MQWTNEQTEAIRRAVEWRDSWSPTNDVPDVFRIFGPAGTGKTTMASEIVAQVGGLCPYLAFTGKAALRLQEKGARTAQTLHSAIYTPKEKSEERLRKLRAEHAQLQDDPATLPADLEAAQKAVDAEEDNLARPSFKLNLQSPIRGTRMVILDEMSMITGEVGIDLMSFGTPVLALGDPYQLPPVGDSKPYFARSAPEVLLTEVHRQAAESPILRLATSVRAGEAPSYGGDDECRVIKKGTLTAADLAGFDQILVGRNATRAVINADVRRLVYDRQTAYPEKGDKLVCCRNDSDLNMMNGGLWEVEDVLFADSPDEMVLTLSDSSGRIMSQPIHKHPFDGRKIPLYDRLERQHFEFGYALTVHKAQGSEWPNVLVIDESRCFRQDRSKWLYTAVTRASQRLTIVR